MKHYIWTHLGSIIFIPCSFSLFLACLSNESHLVIDKFSLCFILGKLCIELPSWIPTNINNNFCPKHFHKPNILEFFHNLFLFRFLLAMARVGIGFTWTYLGIPTWGLGVTNIILVFMSISTAKGVGSWICARWCRSSPSLLKFVSSILWIILNIRLNEVL